MENRNIEVGLRIRKARNDKGLTQKALAEAIGRTESLIAQYERGKVEIPLSGLEKLAKALEIDTSELLYGNSGELGSAFLQNKKAQLVVSELNAAMTEFAEASLLETFYSLNGTERAQLSQIVINFRFLNQTGQALLLADAEKYLSSPALHNVEDASVQPTEETPTDT